MIRAAMGGSITRESASTAAAHKVRMAVMLDTDSTPRTIRPVRSSLRVSRLTRSTSSCIRAAKSFAKWSRRSRNVGTSS